MGYKKYYGFTLIELLIVISIVSTISATSYFGFTNASQQARATRVLSDLQKLEAAWKLWHLDNGAYIDEEIIFSGSNNGDCGAPSADDPTIAMTDLIRRQSFSSVHWKGPYLNAPIRDPFGRQYLYDNDVTETYPATLPHGGVNVMMHYCGNGAQYLDIQRRIDQIVDKTDGISNASRDGGKVHWDDNNLYYMISPQSGD